MNALASAIQSAGLTGTPTEKRTALQSTVSLPHNHTLWSYSGVATQFGAAAAEGLAAAMTAARLTTAVLVYAGKGMDLSLDITQTQLDAIAAGEPQLADVCAGLKQIGRPTAILWQHLGLETLPTVDEIAAADEQIATAGWAASLQNEVITPMVAGGEATIEQIKAAVAVYEG